MMEAHQLALNRAKIQLMTHDNSAFFTTVLFNLVHIWDNSVGTAATNGKYIKYNIPFFMALDAEERLFLLLHETLHVVFMHMLRRGERDPRIWNIAADYVINALLISLGYKMPKMGLYEPEYAEMSVDAIYEILINKKKEELEEVPWEDLIDASEDFEESKAIEEEITEILVRAAIASKIAEDKPGTIPGEVQIFLDNLLTPKLPWHRILRRDMTSLAKHGYSFRRPNRRYLPDHYLPSPYNESLINVAAAIDASGSVSDYDFSTIVTETVSIFKTVKPKKMTLIQFDTDIKEVSNLHSINDLRNVKFNGRGGTEIGPVLKWAATNKPQLLLIFTDGYFDFNDDDPIIKSKVIWLIHNNNKFNAPFGKTIHYTIKR